MVNKFRGWRLRRLQRVATHHGRGALGVVRVVGLGERICNAAAILGRPVLHQPESGLHTLDRHLETDDRA